MYHQTGQRTTFLGTLGVLAICVVFVACGSSAPTANNPIGGNGPPGDIKDPDTGNVSSTGLFAGSNAGEEWEVCFNLAADGNSLTASSACDLDNDQNDSNAFEIEKDGSCNFNFEYTATVPVNNGTFSVQNWQPDLNAPTFSFSGTINGNSASGTAWGANSWFNCSFNWTASAN